VTAIVRKILEIVKTLFGRRDNTSHSEILCVHDPVVGNISIEIEISGANGTVKISLNQSCLQLKTHGLYALERSRAIASIVDRYFPDSFGVKSLSFEIQKPFNASITTPKTASDAIRYRPSAGQLLWPIVSPPEGIDLFNYQRTGVEFLTRRSGAILADDMGLGKTVQSIVAMRTLFFTGAIESCLIVCPKTVVENWIHEVQKWAPSLSVMAATPSSTERSGVLAALLGKCNLVVTNYEQLRAGLNDFKSASSDLVVADEAHRLRGAKSQVSAAFRSLDAGRIWMLTGTPVENRPSDLANLLSLIHPGVFSENSARMGKAALRTQAKPFMLRRHKSDVLVDLPAVVYRQEHLKMDELQSRAYQSAERDWINSEADQKLAAFTRMRGVCDLVPEIGESVKCDRIVEILTNLSEIGEKAVVFSHRIPPIEELEKRLVRGDVGKYISITGQTEREERVRLLEQFVSDPNINIALLSQQAASEGLTLTAASNVIFINEWWNPSSNNQARDRLVRIGQERVVTQWTFVVENTIENRLQRILAEKRSDYDTLVERLAVAGKL
jgi:SNF2 family DNA or RNA helicase